MPLAVSEGYHHGCRFEARPVLSGRVHFHQAGGVRDLQLGRDKNPEMSQLCFGAKAYLAAALSKHLPSRSIHLQTVVWYKIALVLRLWLFWAGGAPRPSFLLHDSRSRRFPLPDQLPFFLQGPFLTLEPKAATLLVLPLVFPCIPEWLMASVSWIPRSSAFWLIQRTVTGGCLPSSPFRFISTIYTTDVSVRY